jgi:hypothetical protein
MIKCDFCDNHTSMLKRFETVKDSAMRIYCSKLVYDKIKKAGKLENSLAIIKLYETLL